MKCPVDGNTLVISERQGVEIDYCPQCRGVWLDRGELDKIIERSAPTPAAAPQRSASYDHDDEYAGSERGSKKRKMGSFLEDIFDF